MFKQIKFVKYFIFYFFISCNSNFQQKPKGYFLINLPNEHQYNLFNDPNYPYSFEYPTYSNLVKDSTFFELSPKNSYWINIDFPKYNCKVYLSYNDVNGKSDYKIRDKKTGLYVDSLGKNSFDKLRKDAFDLTSKHIYKSTNIPNEYLRTPNGVTGIMFNVGGNAASPYQFFLTDTTKHFLRGALYFDATPNSDSTKPVADFFYKDVQHLINTLRWK